MTQDPQPSLFDSWEQPPTRFAEDVAAREVRCKKLLNWCQIDDYSLNCYVGCGHGCGYCYARFMERFHPHDEPWGKFVDVRMNAPEALARQVRRLRPGSVFTCSACDGWQPVEAHYNLTRECCRILLEAGFSLNILTKSRLVLRDLDLFAGRKAQVGVTITTLDERWVGIFEPGAASVADRVEVLKQAKQAGLKTAVMFGPLLPGISDSDEKLADLFKLAADLDVDQVWTDVLNLRPRVWPSLQQTLRKHRPELYEQYRRVLFDAGSREAYRRKIQAGIRRASKRAGIASGIS